jgi:hypothetical protein
MNRTTATIGIGAAVIGALAALVGAARAGKLGDRAQSIGTGTDGDGPSGHTAPAQPAPTGNEGHPVPDLAAGNDVGPTHRAPEAFRPDMDAPMTAAEREALRPATGPSPSLVSNEGASVQGPGGDRY